MNTKELKKLADACRKAGIKHFKNADFEFTLSEDGPISNYKKRSLAKSQIQEPGSQITNSIASDTLTEDALLFWSSGELDKEESTQ